MTMPVRGLDGASEAGAHAPGADLARGFLERVLGETRRTARAADEAHDRVSLEAAWAVEETVGHVARRLGISVLPPRETAQHDGGTVRAARGDRGGHSGPRRVPDEQSMFGNEERRLALLALEHPDLDHRGLWTALGRKPGRMTTITVMWKLAEVAFRARLARRDPTVDLRPVERQLLARLPADEDEMLARFHIRRAMVDALERRATRLITRSDLRSAAPGSSGTPPRETPAPATAVPAEAAADSGPVPAWIARDPRADLPALTRAQCRAYRIAMSGPTLLTSPVRIARADDGVELDPASVVRIMREGWQRFEHVVSPVTAADGLTADEQTLRRMLRERYGTAVLHEIVRRASYHRPGESELDVLEIIAKADFPSEELREVRRIRAARVRAYERTRRQDVNAASA